MEGLTLNLTPAVYDALIDACAVANRAELEASRADKTRYDPITLQDYIEECVINRLVELGLLRKKKGY